MIPQEAAYKQVFGCGLGSCLAAEGVLLMKGLADTLRDPWNVAAKECQPRVHFQSIKN